MGAIKEWTSKYPAVLDGVAVGEFETVADLVDDVLASHANAPVISLIEVEKELIAYKDNISFAGSVNEVVEDADRNIDIVIGAVLLDGEKIAPTASDVVASFRLMGIFLNNAAAGVMELKLFDTGVPGGPLIPPILRSTISILDTEGGRPAYVSTTLSSSGSPGVNTDEIFTGPRVYEIRVNLASPTAGDTCKVLWGGLSLGVPQP